MALCDDLRAAVEEHLQNMVQQEIRAAVSPLEIELKALKCENAQLRAAVERNATWFVATTPIEEKK